MKGNCGECERRWFCDINPDECDAWPDPVPMTNADHIRSMTDEELAEFLVRVGINPISYDADFEDGWETTTGHMYTEKEDALHAETCWLKAPYKEDT